MKNNVIALIYHSMNTKNLGQLVDEPNVSKYRKS